MWYPAVEAQAADRAHRIGQDKPVTVSRMVARGHRGGGHPRSRATACSLCSRSSVLGAAVELGPLALLDQEDRAAANLRILRDVHVRHELVLDLRWVTCRCEGSGLGGQPQRRQQPVCQGGVYQERRAGATTAARAGQNAASAAR